MRAIFLRRRAPLGRTATVSKAVGEGRLPKALPAFSSAQLKKAAQAAFRLSKKWLAPLFRGVHSSLAPTARPGSYAGKPLLRKAFCGFDAHVAKSDESLKWLRSSIRQRFLDKLKAAQAAFEIPLPFLVPALTKLPPQNTPRPLPGRTGPRCSLDGPAAVA